MGVRRNGWAGRLLDLGAYAVGLTVLVSVALVPPSLLVGAGLNGIKVGLFLTGVFAFGYATLLLWPSRPAPEEFGPDEGRQTTPEGSGASTDRLGSRDGAEPCDETRFESLVGLAPPLAWYEVPRVNRFHPGTKLYVASLFMLAVSYALEVVFGV